MNLLDVNVLLALVDANHACHYRAKHFFVSRQPAAWATCPLVENGFLRILSGSAYPNRVDSPKIARLLLDQMILSSVGHQFWPDDLTMCDAKIFPDLPSAKQLTDCYLLALAVKRGGKLVTFDRRIDPAWVKGGARALLVLDA